MHLKNWALLIREKKVGLAPCYDLVCSKIYLPQENDSALTLCGKNDQLKRSDFSAMAAGLQIDAKAAGSVFEKFRRAQEPLLETVGRSELSAPLKRKLDNVIKTRYQRIYGDGAGVLDIPGATA